MKRQCCVKRADIKTGTATKYRSWGCRQSSPSQWISRKAFGNLGFGSAGRNILTSPGFQDVDFSIAKNTSIKEGISLQFRAEAFNLLNHPNFTQPQNSLTASTFGQITATRSTRGDLGSSRQLQLGMKLIF